MHESTMQSSPMLSLSSGCFSNQAHKGCFSNQAHKESECLEEFCENIRKNDCCNEESLDEEVKTEANGAEITMENLFQEKLKKGDDDDQKEDEFEFPLIATNSGSSPAVADEIFCNGQILPMYSVSGHYSELNGNQLSKSIETTPPVPPAPQEATRLPLRMLFLEDRDTPSSSCSSSEADDLDGVAPGTYCVWEPKIPAAPAEGVEEGQCKKSNSTGSSQRLKFRNFLNRSSSDSGRDRLVLSPSNNESNAKKKDEKSEKSGDGRGKLAVDLSVKSGGEKRRQSLLPYRRDMVGFFGNANGTSWNLHLF